MKLAKSTARRWGRVVAFLLVVSIAAGVTAPFVNAAPFSGRIQVALEALLGRKVSFSQAHFTLLNGPGFSLSKVVIEDDPRFGAEPLAYVPTLDARIRLDRLVLGQIVVSSVRLNEPSVNLVRNNEGAWNMAELIARLGRPSGMSLNLFPAVQITDGRVDFKLGVRKTNIYITETGLSIYRDSPGKLYVQFSGSPARTDRAGNGFGHVSGTVNWYLHPETSDGNQLEGDLKLDRSNLSELSTLFRGEDAGVHGTISGHARIAGPAAALHLAGDMRLEDIHRWDLLPSSGEDWMVAYNGVIDLPARSVDLKTVPLHGHHPEVQLALKGTSILSKPSWSILANLDGAPAAGLLPLARRMGLGLPDVLSLGGKISGAVAFSTENGWTGGVGISDFVASVPNAPAFRADTVTATIASDRIHLQSARLPSNSVPAAAGEGWLDISGDYHRQDGALQIALKMNKYPAQDLRSGFGDWFQAPEALGSLRAGYLTGLLDFDRSPGAESKWSGKLAFDSADLKLDGVSETITDAHGQVSFDPGTLDVEHFSGEFGKHRIEAAFHGDPSGHRAARVRLECPSFDLADVEKLLLPGLHEGWLARLGVTKHEKPVWLKNRNLQADIHLANVSLNGSALGSLRSRVRWQGANVQVTALRVEMPQGEIDGAGTVNLSGTSPKYRLEGTLDGLPWRGGLVSAEGRVDTNGSGTDLLQRTVATGKFSGHDLTFAPDNSFNAVSGLFQLSFADGWPDLRLTNLEATDGEEQWTGAAASQSDGKLVLDLEHEGRQRHVISTLAPDTVPSLSSASAMRRSF